MAAMPGFCFTGIKGELIKYGRHSYVPRSSLFRAAAFEDRTSWSEHSQFSAIQDKIVKLKVTLSGIIKTDVF
jgi:hypothetical protein